MEEFIKFPRTPHLFSAGGAIPRDDLLADDKFRKSFFTQNVTVEEKIDGSNLGFTLDPKTFQIMAQNRSHHVTSQSHSSFKLLDQWITEHPKLFEVLQPHYILYGEWLYAQHSVYYDRLPGYFIAFDIYDRQAKKFLSVAERDKRLKGTGIPVIRTVASGVFKTEDDYKKLLLTEPTLYCAGGAQAVAAAAASNSTASVAVADKKKKNNEKSFKMEKLVGGAQPLEGIYIRVDEGPYLKYRAKIVRPDFIQTVDGSDHWSTKEVVKNTVDIEWMYQLQQEADQEQEQEQQQQQEK